MREHRLANIKWSFRWRLELNQTASLRQFIAGTNKAFAALTLSLSERFKLSSNEECWSRFGAIDLGISFMRLWDAKPYLSLTDPKYSLLGSRTFIAKSSSARYDEDWSGLLSKFEVRTVWRQSFKSAKQKCRLYFLFLAYPCFIMIVLLICLRTSYRMKDQQLKTIDQILWRDEVSHQNL